MPAHDRFRCAGFFVCVAFPFGLGFEPTNAREAVREMTTVNHIYTPTAEELDARIGRFDELRPMSTASDLEWVPTEAWEIFFAQKIMAVVLEDTKSPFGNDSPIVGAAGATMFISVMPPGQGPCLHSHNNTFETFMVLQGSIEYRVGDPVVHKRTLNKWDVFSCPPGVYREFRNVGDETAVQLTMLTGPKERDDVTIPDSVRERVANQFGDNVADAFGALMAFDPPPA
jgi:quercetin dioxygenase-like cupin family protein